MNLLGKVLRVPLRWAARVGLGASLFVWLTASAQTATNLPVNIAVHYYPWYTTGRWSYQECAGGTLREQLDLPQHPALGNYDSSAQNTIDTHLRWCSQYNISTLILEFYGPGTDSDLVCRNALFKNPHAGDVQLGMLYDWAIRFGDTAITASRLTTVSNDFRYLAQFYFSQTNYLRSPDGRAVVMLYISRALTGDLDGFAKAMRSAAAVFHQTLYLVGDEFFYIASPDPVRIHRWDAIYGYDVYASRGGYWGQTGNAAYFQKQMTAFRKAANSTGTHFFPSIAPGFNDRAVRRTCANNPAAARRLTADSSPTSLFASSFDYAVATELDTNFPVLCITSFNEWHEDTMIEPTAGVAASTTMDTSATKIQYTQGLEYDDFGYAYLELIRDRTVAVSGQALLSQQPVPNARIEVQVDGAFVALIKADSFGYYKVLRSLAAPGANVTVQVRDPALGLSPARSVLVPAGSTATGADLAMVPRPILGAETSGGSFILSFDAAAGIRYQVLTSSDLLDWTAVGSPQAGTGATATITIGPTDFARYYRVELSP